MQSSEFRVGFAQVCMHCNVANAAQLCESIGKRRHAPKNDSWHSASGRAGVVVCAMLTAWISHMWYSAEKWTVRKPIRQTLSPCQLDTLASRRRSAATRSDDELICVCECVILLLCVACPMHSSQRALRCVAPFWRVHVPRQRQGLYVIVWRTLAQSFTSLYFAKRYAVHHRIALHVVCTYIRRTLRARLLINAHARNFGHADDAQNVTQVCKFMKMIWWRRGIILWQSLCLAHSDPNTLRNAADYKTAKHYPILVCSNALRVCHIIH